VRRWVRRLLREGADPHESIDWAKTAAVAAVELIHGSRDADADADPDDVRRAARLVEAAAQQSAR